MKDPGGVVQLDQKRLVRLVLRHLPLVLVSVLIGLLAAAGYVASRGVTYTATTQLVVDEPASVTSLLDSGAGARPTDRLVDSQLRRLQSDRMRQQVAQALGGDRAPFSVGFASSTDTNVVGVTVSSSSASTARDAATAYGTVYLQGLTADSNQLIAQTTTQLQQGIDGLTTQINDLQNQISNATSTTLQQVQAVVAPARDQLLSRRAVLQRQLDQLQIVNNVGSPTNARVLSSPEAAKSSVRDVVSPLLLGALLGLLLGLAAVAVREAVAGTVVDDQDLAVAGLSARSVTRLPARAPERLVPRSADRLAPRELSAYAVLAATLFPPHLQGRTPGPVLLAPVDDRRPHAVMLASRLAAALAAQGRSVAVVDADPAGLVSTAFEVHSGPGLTDLVRGARSLEDVLHGQTGVAVVPAGPDATGSELSSPVFADVLTALQQRFDVVLVVGAPLVGAAESWLVAPLAAGAVLAVRGGRTRRRDVAQVATLLAEQRSSALSSPDVVVQGGGRGRRPRGGRTVPAAHSERGFVPQRLPARTSAPAPAAPRTATPLAE